MKRRKRKPQQRKKAEAPAPPTAAEAAEAAPSRRQFLGKLRNGGIAALVVGGGGWVVVKDVQATMREHDLTRIGNGTPAVVQIHDPECSKCVALQREARDALCEIGEAKLQFLVANIRTEKGSALASAHGVAHVTLLLFDAEGKRRDILVGPRGSEELNNAFLGHLARYGKGS